uniref:Uncharacterized protein n=1 Tax=Leptospirillum sp. Group II '5-way CG' TaxID=419541 RepID=B6ARY0_9BACT|nr:MAG: Hypothetical protein CGL2_10601002 [Leptospirillum sp. Group II '5-way CG']
MPRQREPYRRRPNRDRFSTEPEALLLGRQTGFSGRVFRSRPIKPFEAVFERAPPYGGTGPKRSTTGAGLDWAVPIASDRDQDPPPF